MPDIEIHDLPTVVIVGRPNVGKSTWFNRVIGEQAAIVEDRPGITRDRHERLASWLGVQFRIVDTGGWQPAGSALDDKVSRQVEQAVREADLVIFMVDASVGPTDDDESVAQWLRKIGTPVLLAANKADNERREVDRWSFLSLGLGDPYPVSALHGRRAGDFLDEVIARLPERVTLEVEVPVTPSDVPRVALVGRPNVGKSTLFNRLVGEERSVVHDMPGTTRDSIDTLVETEDGPLVFIDTAGMRRKSRIDDSAEYFSLVRALQAIDLADIAMLVIDATVGVTSQDQRLAERVDASGCPVLIVLNKWELLESEQRREVEAELARKLYFVGEAPVLKISALSGKGVHKLRPVLQEAISLYNRRVPTKDVNRVLAEAQQRQPAGGGARVVFAVQGASEPPTFTLFVNREIPQPYLRYLERSLREAFDLGSTPIKLRVRKRSEA
ncbi:MAG: ribosome biogenesis GTPase Der [Ilumatobacteraceae bacterium]|jgi:GTP-binding protein|nr:ribosome biogenesis GTPase Der [Ilumatobacteraceae bacterium]